MSEMTEYIAYCFLFIAVTYGYYVICASLLKVYGKQRIPILVKIFLGVFIVCFDVPLNILVVSLLSLELPKEFTVTARFKRWRNQYEHKAFNQLSWIKQKRLLVAVNVCDQLLDPYDPTGDHC